MHRVRYGGPNRGDSFDHRLIFQELRSIMLALFMKRSHNARTVSIHESQREWDADVAEWEVQEMHIRLRVFLCRVLVLESYQLLSIAVHVGAYRVYMSKILSKPT